MFMRRTLRESPDCRLPPTPIHLRVVRISRSPTTKYSHSFELTLPLTGEWLLLSVVGKRTSKEALVGAGVLVRLGLGLRLDLRAPLYITHQ